MISGAYKSEYADQKAFDIVAKKVLFLALKLGEPRKAVHNFVNID
jgi:hypothetical protein